MQLLALGQGSRQLKYIGRNLGLKGFLFVQVFPAHFLHHLGRYLNPKGESCAFFRAKWSER